MIVPDPTLLIWMGIALFSTSSIFLIAFGKHTTKLLAVGIFAILTALWLYGLDLKTSVSLATVGILLISFLIFKALKSFKS